MLLSRAEAGQIPIVPRPLDLRRMLENLVAQFQPQFAVDQVALDLVVAPDLPLAWADPDRVNQVLINLLANAFRYTPGDGQVTLRARVRANCLLITVQDTGVGIDPQHLAHLFERFYRVDKSRARVSGGNGIGLTIARHLVYAQGGEIWAESRGKGYGSSFHFTLPVDTHTTADPDDAPSQPLPTRERCMAYKQDETAPRIEGYSVAAGDG